MIGMQMTPDLEALTAELESVGAQSASLNEQWRELRNRRDALVDDQIRSMPDEDFMGDETVLRWLLREAWSNTVAHHRVEKLAKPDLTELRINGIDGRDEYASDCLPMLQVALTRGQDTEHVATAIRDWAQAWALGRATLPVDILERSLSANGSWRINYDISSGNAEIDLMRWHHGSVESAGTLDEALRHVADNLWYEES